MFTPGGVLSASLYDMPRASSGILRFRWSWFSIQHLWHIRVPSCECGLAQTQRGDVPLPGWKLSELCVVWSALHVQHGSALTSRVVSAQAGSTSKVATA